MRISQKEYNRRTAVTYALEYGLFPNPKYPYYQGNDCTNFVSQCLQAGGCKNHYHSSHPWWCEGNNTSICWSVAASLYWYIKVCTEEKRFGIKAKTIIIEGDDQYNKSIAKLLQPGDIIQYINTQGRIQHSAVITDFIEENNLNHPLISQHTFEATQIPWKKGFKKTIFHHILEIN